MEAWIARAPWPRSPAPACATYRPSTRRSVGFRLGLVFFLVLAGGRLGRVLVLVRFLDSGIDHLHLGLVVEAHAALNDDLFARTRAVQHLHLVAVAHAEPHGAAVHDRARINH